MIQTVIVVIPAFLALFIASGEGTSKLARRLSARSAFAAGGELANIWSTYFFEYRHL